MYRSVPQFHALGTQFVCGHTQDCAFSGLRSLSARRGTDSLTPTVATIVQSRARGGIHAIVFACQLPTGSSLTVGVAKETTLNPV